jgi:hypothetical protein
VEVIPVVLAPPVGAAVPPAVVPLVPAVEAAGVVVVVV